MIGKVATNGSSQSGARLARAGLAFALPPPGNKQRAGQAHSPAIELRRKTAPLAGLFRRPWVFSLGSQPQRKLILLCPPERVTVEVKVPLI
jgi:hypothetical protein